jgi:predicted ATPase
VHELERQVLQQDPALRAAPAGNLPSLQAALVGRDDDVAALARSLETERLVEVVGPGGIGKTAVAIATGRALPGSVWLARLEDATTADDVLDTVIAALNVSGGEAALLERLRAARTVLILDNCEHVRDAAAALAVRVLDAAPELRILATSQVALDVEGETVHELAPLGLEHAVELFTRRAARAGDDPTDLCRALDGLPLAIELAAARTRTLSVDEIARRLDDRFAVLSDPTSRKPERRRALRATIGWSYELLFPDDKRGLWALATFAGGAPLAAVESVLEALDVPAAAAIDVIGRLAGRSLVIVDNERFRLLDSIRAFALEEMGEAKQRGLGAHAAWFAAAAAESTAGVRSARQASFLEFARTERANIDAALAWSAAHDPQRALALANGFGWAWIVLGDHRGAQRLLARSTPPATPPRRRTAPRRCCSRRGSRPPQATSSPPGATSIRRPRSPTARSSRPAVPITSPTSSPTTATGSTRSS